MDLFIASLTHSVHNAEYTAFYPDIPAGLARETVGLEALLVARTRLKLPGLVLIAAYGASGIDGLAHFTQGLCAEQTLAINLSIWFEVLARLSQSSLLPTSARFIGRTVSKRSADT